MEPLAFSGRVESFESKPIHQTISHGNSRSDVFLLIADCVPYRISVSGDGENKSGIRRGARMSIRRFLLSLGTGLLFVCARAAGADVALLSGTNDAFESARVEQLLIQAGFTPRHVSMQDSWDGLSLLVLVDPTVPLAAWGKELQFTQKLPTY